MLKLRLISPGMMSSIQDAGRFGYRHFGIPVSGYMDSASAELANLLVGNAPGSALIECTYQACRIEADQACEIAITGADMNWKLDGEPIQLNTKIDVAAGQIISGGFTQAGMRAYLAVAGKLIGGTETMGSRSTYQYANFGGLKGTALMKEDIISYETRKSIFNNISLSSKEIKLDAKTIKLIPGPEYGMLSQTEQNGLYSTSYQISSEANRMGARLAHHPLTHQSIQLENSKPTCPGMIQLLPSGHLIVLLQDGQTTGGYPRIGYISNAQLNLFNQIRIGQYFEFIR